MIKEVKNQYTFQMINDRFVKTLYAAKKTPNDRALSFKVLNSAINTFVENVVDHEAKARTALDLPQPETWQCIPDDWTDEQKTAHIAAE